MAIVYDKPDLKENEAFAEAIAKEFRDAGCFPRVVAVDVRAKGAVDLSGIQLVVNRSRSVHFLGKKYSGFVVNDPNFCQMANDKLETYKWARFNGIKALETKILKPAEQTVFPCVVKPIGGHGGKGVRKISDRAELDKIDAGTRAYVVQDYFPGGNVDVRVYVMFKKIFAAVARGARGEGEFRANLTVGGDVKKHRLTGKQRRAAKRIIALLPPGYYGLDFFLDGEGGFVLNEIEDAVGCRGLYRLDKNADVPRLYVKAILSNLNGLKKWDGDRWLADEVS